jgi:hypothetical protein
MAPPMCVSEDCIAGWWLRCGDDGSTKKGAGHASQPVQFLPPASSLFTLTLSGGPNRDELTFSFSHDIASPLDCVLSNDGLMWFVRHRSILGRIKLGNEETLGRIKLGNEETSL